MSARCQLSRRTFVGLCLSSLAGCGPSRAVLPPAKRPFTRTPDAAFRRAPPAPGPTPPLALPSIERQRLDNGLALLLVPRPGVPYVSVNLVVRGAGEGSQPNRPGLAALTAGMLLRGSRRPGGGVWLPTLHHEQPTVATAAGYVRGSVDVLSAALDEALVAMASVVRAPAFAPDELVRQRRAQLEAIGDESRQVLGLLQRLGTGLLYGDKHRLARAPSGTSEGVASLGVADVRAFHRHHYNPSDAALVLVGDFAAGPARTSVQQTFGSWRGASAAAAPLASEVRRPAGLAIHAVHGPTPQTHLEIVSPGPARAHPDFDSCVLIGHLLGRLFESRGNRALRHATGASYGAHFAVEARRGGGELVFFSVVDNGEAGRATRHMLVELERIRREPVTAQELAVAKTRYRAELNQVWASNSSAARLLAQHFAFEVPPSALSEVESRLAAITAATLQQVARRYFDPAHSQVVTYTNLDETLDQLRRVAPVVRYRVR
jgi:predicted Zn-dependent peptidase